VRRDVAAASLGVTLKLAHPSREALAAMLEGIACECLEHCAARASPVLGLGVDLPTQRVRQ
jgi:hypothetical protein